MPADETSTTGGQGDNAQANPPNQQIPTLMGHISSNKIEAVLWLTRVCTVLCTVFYLLPLLGNPYTFYQRALISSAATSALRLHQRLPPFQMSREFLATMMLEDSCHYLMYSILFLGSNPLTMALTPVFLFALLHAKTYTKSLLNISGPGHLQFLHNLIFKLEQQQVNMLRFIACAEIFLMPAIIFMMFSGQASLFLPFIYYRFVTLRYSSRRNPYSRAMFSELRMTVVTLCSRPQCPAFIRNLCHKLIAFISRLAPQAAASS